MLYTYEFEPLPLYNMYYETSNKCFDLSINLCMSHTFL